MHNDYLPWPAEKENRIQVSLYNGNSPVPPHKHDFIEIVFIANGSCIHKYHNSEITLIPGDVFIVTPHEEHWYAINSKTVIYNCLFYPEALGDDWIKVKEISSLYNFLVVEPFYRVETNHQEILHLQPQEVSYMEQVLKSMMEEQGNRYTGYQLAKKANLIMVLTFLGRLWEKQFHTSLHSYNGKREMLAEALKHIEQNISDELKIGDLATRVYLSPHYFRKLFREVTGLTPIEYINKIRISKAAQLLSAQNLSVAEVSEIVGINDVNYFSRLFKAVTGCSPSDFRKMNNLY